MRNPLQVEVIRYRKEIGRNSFKYRGGVLWNSINSNLKSQENVATFKNKTKDYKKNVNQHSFEKRLVSLIMRTKTLGTFDTVNTLNFLIACFTFIFN